MVHGVAVVLSANELSALPVWHSGHITSTEDILVRRVEEWVSLHLSSRIKVHHTLEEVCVGSSALTYDYDISQYSASITEHNTLLSDLLQLITKVHYHSVLLVFGKDHLANILTKVFLEGNFAPTYQVNLLLIFEHAFNGGCSFTSDKASSHYCNALCSL